MATANAWLTDLSERWSDLFDDPLHSIYAAGACIAILLIATAVILWFRPAEVRKLAWRVFLASAAFYVLNFIPWFWSSRLPVLDDWKSILIVPLIALTTLLIILAVNYWCVAILLAWRYKNHSRHSWHVWSAWLSTTSWILWSLFNGGL